MELKQFGVRLPETLCKYLKHKSHLSGMSMQQLMVTIIVEYQQNDVEYKEALNRLMTEIDKPKDKSERQGGENDV